MIDCVKFVWKPCKKAVTFRMSGPTELLVILSNFSCKRVHKSRCMGRWGLFAPSSHLFAFTNWLDCQPFFWEESPRWLPLVSVRIPSPASELAAGIEPTSLLGTIVRLSRPRYFERSKITCNQSNSILQSCYSSSGHLGCIYDPSLNYGGSFELPVALLPPGKPQISVRYNAYMGLSK